nr:LysR family transcriptional regulator [Pseudoxanthomonas broegbernensis]
MVLVAEHGSMAAAARKLNITAAAVAQQIRALEREMGTPLVTRAGRTVGLTEAGARMLEPTRQLLRDVADLRSFANDGTLSGELRLGACPTVLAGLVPDVLSRMVADFPQINVFIKPSYSAELYADVERGVLDAAIVLQAPYDLPKTCRFEVLREEPLVVLVPERFAGRDAHEVLREEPLIRYDRHQWGGRLADDYLRRVGIAPRERFELNALNAIAVMVDRGLGVSLVPDWAPPWPEGIRVARLPLPEPCEPRRIGLVWSPGGVRARAVTALREECLRACEAQRAG